MSLLPQVEVLIYSLLMRKGLIVQKGSHDLCQTNEVWSADFYCFVEVLIVCPVIIWFSQAPLFIIFPCVRPMFVVCCYVCLHYALMHYAAPFRSDQPPKTARKLPFVEKQSVAGSGEITGQTVLPISWMCTWMMAGWCLLDSGHTQLQLTCA